MNVWAEGYNRGLLRRLDLLTDPPGRNFNPWLAAITRDLASWHAARSSLTCISFGRLRPHSCSLMSAPELGSVLGCWLESSGIRRQARSIGHKPFNIVEEIRPRTAPSHQFLQDQSIATTLAPKICSFASLSPIGMMLFGLIALASSNFLNHIPLYSSARFCNA